MTHVASISAALRARAARLLRDHSPDLVVKVAMIRWRVPLANPPAASWLSQFGGSTMSRLLPRNEHPVERIVRVVLGLLVLSLFFFGPQTPWALLGLVPLTTGLFGSCPIYTLLGISTCHVKPELKSTP
jgi:DUF2892 family protein